LGSGELVCVTAGVPLGAVIGMSVGDGIAVTAKTGEDVPAAVGILLEIATGVSSVGGVAVRRGRGGIGLDAGIEANAETLDAANACGGT